MCGVNGGRNQLALIWNEITSLSPKNIYTYAQTRYIQSAETSLHNTNNRRDGIFLLYLRNLLYTSSIKHVACATSIYTSVDDKQPYANDHSWLQYLSSFQPHDRAFQFAIRIDSFCKKNRPFDSLVVMQFFLLIYCIIFSCHLLFKHTCTNTSNTVIFN